PLLEGAHSQRRLRTDWNVHYTVDVAIVALSITDVETARGLVQNRFGSRDGNHSRAGVLAEQRTLGSLQDLDLLQVVKAIQAYLSRRIHDDIIHHYAHGLFRPQVKCLGTHAAYLESTAILRIVLQPGHDILEVGHVPII